MTCTSSETCTDLSSSLLEVIRKFRFHAASVPVERTVGVEPGAEVDPAVRTRHALCTERFEVGESLVAAVKPLVRLGRLGEESFTVLPVDQDNRDVTVVLPDLVADVDEDPGAHFGVLARELLRSADDLARIVPAQPDGQAVAAKPHVDADERAASAPHPPLAARISLRFGADAAVVLRILGDLVHDGLQLPEIFEHERDDRAVVVVRPLDALDAECTAGLVLIQMPLGVLAVVDVDVRDREA